jgi:hypothetical protein
MEDDIARFILQSLCERSEGTKEQIVLTSAERAAIHTLFGASLRDSPSQPSPTKQDFPATPKIVAPFAPKVAWHPHSEVEDNVLICLDFGTSFSKAFGCQGDDTNNTPNLIDISFGTDPEGRARFLQPSELFIQGEDIYFGAAARDKFELVDATQDTLIDNPKQYMTLGTDVANLHQKLLRKEQDPTGKFSQRDMLVLYLAHLNRMADTSLQDGGKYREVRRRYTHPAWKKETEKANGSAMARIMVEAIALSRLFPDDFGDKCNLDRALKLATAAHGASDSELPFEMLKESVREATAAGAGALMATDEGQRQAYVILDIGAGTTDVAGCVCINNSIKGEISVAEITSAADALSQAGNSIDNALLKHILDSSSLAQGTSEYSHTSQSLRRSIRAYKEALFNERFIVVTLVTGETVEVELDAFLKLPMILKFFKSIADVVTNAAFKISDERTSVFLVPTGGGAGLPIVEQLVGKPLSQDNRTLVLKLREAMPEDLKAPYPDLIPVYPQLSVAIGGALPSLPKQLGSIPEWQKDPGKKTLSTIYR